MSAAKTKTKGIASWPQEERPRERLLSKGAQALTDAELVAILIRVGFKGTNAVEMARLLLKQFGSLRAMEGAPVTALLEVKGLKGAKAAQLPEKEFRAACHKLHNEPLRSRASFLSRWKLRRCG